METIEATFRVVTPMFCSGADQTKAELRLPSIKGALRFWWRALVFEHFGNNINDLREAEARLFGGLGKEEGQARVLLRLSQQRATAAEQKQWRPNVWEAYVGYGLIETTGGTSRNFIEPGSSFTLKLTTRQRLPKDELDSLHKALLALGLLGGLGGRSRKGWGSVNLTGLNGTLNWSAPRNRTELEDELDSLLGNRDERPCYTAASLEAEIELGATQRNATAAHKYLADLYKEAVREGYDKREREQFGLPRKNNQQRRASPVFLHIHELPDGQAIPVATFLPAQFLEKQPEPAGGNEKILSFLSNVASGGIQ